MKNRAFHKVTLVGVIMLVVLVLVLLLIPGIAAQVNQIGIIAPYEVDPTCYMYEPIMDNPPIIKAHPEAEVFINLTPGSNVPPDVVALLKCHTTITNTLGYAVTYSGSNLSGCRAYFIPGNDEATDLTSSWSQTISASGNAVLSCHFKRNPNF